MSGCVTARQQYSRQCQARPRWALNIHTPNIWVPRMGSHVYFCILWMHKCGEAINQGALGSGWHGLKAVSALFRDMGDISRTHETKTFSLDAICWKVPTLSCGLSPRFNRQHSQVAEHNVLGFIMEILRHSGGGDGGGRGGARGSHWSDPCQTLRHIRSWRLKLDVSPGGGQKQQTNIITIIIIVTMTCLFVM